MYFLSKSMLTLEWCKFIIFSEYSRYLVQIYTLNLRHHLKIGLCNKDLRLPALHSHLLYDWTQVRSDDLLSVGIARCAPTPSCSQHFINEIMGG